MEREEELSYPTIVVSMLLLLHRGKRRRLWVHDINLRRSQQGDFGNVLQELQSDENLFFQGIQCIVKSLNPSVRQLFAQNFIYSANDSECSRKLFAQIIRANIRVRVSVNTRAKTTPRTFARTARTNYSRQCESGISK